MGKESENVKIRIRDPYISRDIFFLDTDRVKIQGVEHGGLSVLDHQEFQPILVLINFVSIGILSAKIFLKWRQRAILTTSPLPPPPFPPALRATYHKLVESKEGCSHPPRSEHRTLCWMKSPRPQPTQPLGHETRLLEETPSWEDHQLLSLLYQGFSANYDTKMKFSQCLPNNIYDSNLLGDKIQTEFKTLIRYIYPTIWEWDPVPFNVNPHTRNLYGIWWIFLLFICLCP